jgi:galactonate dehydratase
MKKIAAMAEAYCVMVAPHNPMGPLATAVSAHFAACTPNFLVLEYTPDDATPRKDLLREPPAVKYGYLHRAGEAGIRGGTQQAFRRYPPRAWHRGFEYRADGSVAFI